MDVLEDFFAAACSQDERLSKRLTVADTVWTTHVTDADRSFTIYFNRFPIEFRREADTSAEVVTWASAKDNIDIWTGFTFMGLSIANGMMEYEGPVRKMLRVVPMLRPLGLRGFPRTDPQAGVQQRRRIRVDRILCRAGRRRRLIGIEREEPPRDGRRSFSERSSWRRADPEAAALSAGGRAQWRAGGGVHEGALEHEEKVPGDFWAIECDDVHKAFGRNQVLDGLNVGIPDGMISVVLGPSGTGKSVLIKHLMGLMFPDQGDVLVHGRVGAEDDDVASCWRCAASSASCSRTARCSARCRSTTTSPSRCASTPTVRGRDPEVVNQRLAEVGLSERRRPHGRASSPAACASARASRARSCSSPRS